mgnify:CR=1 FL=1
MDKALTYKNYTGSIEVSLEDNCLFGKVLFINDLVMYEGETLPELKACFEEAVDDYLKDCEESGDEPNKPFKGSFNVRITPELHKKAATYAACSGSNLNQFVSDAIQDKLDGKTVTYENHEHNHHHITYTLDGSLPKEKEESGWSTSDFTPNLRVVK